MKCKVTITGADGKVHCSSGEYRATYGGCLLEYVYEGDRCELSYDGNIFRQKRRGKFDVDMVFAEGAETLCNFKYVALGLECKLKIFTEKANCKFDGCGCETEIFYLLEGTVNTVCIKAETIKEIK